MDLAIRNATRDVVLHPAPEFATSLWSQTRGFMFRRPGNRAIVFEFAAYREIVLHTFFVRGPLDAIVLDFEHLVIAAISDLEPFRIWDPKVRARRLIELPAGTLASTGTVLGDRIALPRGASALSSGT
jgi:hypothetical protein